MRLRAEGRPGGWRTFGWSLILAALLALAACSTPLAWLPLGAATPASPIPPPATNNPTAAAAAALTQTAQALASADVVAGIATRLPAESATATNALAATPAPRSSASATSAHTATPCAGPDCGLDGGRLWLERPIPPDPAFIDYVDRSYPYGSTQDGLREPHLGVEFFNRSGTPVLAAGAGRVVVAGADDVTAFGPYPNYYGNLVVIQHERTFGGQPIFTLYGHLRSVEVRAGTRVQAGDLLGTVGATGIAIGAHLHFEVRLGRNDADSTRNPELWLLPLPYDGQPQGAIAGRVTDADGNLLPEVTVVIRPLATISDAPRDRYILTYVAEAPEINSDDELQENFAIGDVPPGTYSISVNTTRFYQQTLTVQSGQTAWVHFVVNPPPSPAPRTPTPDTATTEPVVEGTPAAETTPGEGTPGEPAPSEPAPSETPAP